MTTSALTPFLSSPEHVEMTRLGDADFQAFLTLVQKSSGDLVPRQALPEARFRVVDGRNASQDDLKLADTVMSLGQPVALQDLIEACTTIDRTQLAHSLWKIDNFDGVKAWLKAMRAVVRLAYNVEGELRGHVLLAETIIPMVETVERKEYVLPNGDMASDAITRNLGIRAKVFALDRARRLPRGSSEGNSIMERLSRTLSSRGPH